MVCKKGVWYQLLSALLQTAFRSFIIATHINALIDVAVFEVRPRSVPLAFVLIQNDNATHFFVDSSHSLLLLVQRFKLIEDAPFFLLSFSNRCHNFWLRLLLICLASFISVNTVYCRRLTSICFDNSIEVANIVDPLKSIVPINTLNLRRVDLVLNCDSVVYRNRLPAYSAFVAPIDLFIRL